MSHYSKSGRTKHNVAAIDDQGRRDIKSLSLAELESWFEDDLGETKGRALRVYKHLWQQGVTSFDQMDTVPKALRKRLADRAFI